MAHSRVADRGDGLQIWRVAANILNKQSQTAGSGWSSIKLNICYETLRTASEEEELFGTTQASENGLRDLVHGMLGASTGQVH
jgi:hypothetical protein